MQPVTDTDFHELVRENQDPTVVMFTGSWCAPCKRMKPDMEFLANAFDGDVRFVEADIEDCEVTASDLGVRSVPTLVLFNDGMVRDVKSGTQSKMEIRQWINESV